MINQEEKRDLVLNQIVLITINQEGKKRFGFKSDRSNNDQPRGKKRFGFKSDRSNNDQSRGKKEIWF